MLTNFDYARINLVEALAIIQDPTMADAARSVMAMYPIATALEHLGIRPGTLLWEAFIGYLESDKTHES